MISGEQFEQLELFPEPERPKPAASEPEPEQEPVQIDFSKQKVRGKPFVHRPSSSDMEQEGAAPEEVVARRYSPRSQYGKLVQQVRDFRKQQRDTEPVQRPFPGMGLGESPATIVRIAPSIHVEAMRFPEDNAQYFAAMHVHPETGDVTHLATLQLEPGGDVHLDVHHPMARKQGLGRAMIRIADQWAKERVRMRPVPPLSLTPNSEAMVNRMLAEGEVPGA